LLPGSLLDVAIVKFMEPPALARYSCAVLTQPIRLIILLPDISEFIIIIIIGLSIIQFFFEIVSMGIMSVLIYLFGE
jgi:hypothetical protein